jgi:aspartyl protease family protein
MRTILIVACFFVVAGIAMGKMADRLTPAAAAHASTASAPVATNAGVRSINIARDERGHFETEGRIGGRRLGFMVDTGASVVALRSSDAAMIGVRPSASDFNATVTTANGTVKGARTHLDSVEIGDLTVRDVDAMVLPDEALSENLLGLSFLSRLKRFEYAGGRMVLEQ